MIGIGVPILESAIVFLYVQLTGTFWVLIQKSTGMVQPFLRFGRTSHQIYRSSTTSFSIKHSSVSKLSIFLFNAHLALYVRRMTQLQSLNSIGIVT